MTAGDDILERTALALLRVDLELLPPATRQEARKLLKQSGDSFDGERLVELCLDGRAGESDQTIQRAMNALRSRLVGLETAAKPRRKPSFFKRLSATLLAKLIFFVIYVVLIVLLLYLLHREWEWLDIYAFGDKVLALLKSE